MYFCRMCERDGCEKCKGSYIPYKQRSGTIGKVLDIWQGQCNTCVSIISSFAVALYVSLLNTEDMLVIIICYPSIKKAIKFQNRFLLHLHDDFLWRSLHTWYSYSNITNELQYIHAELHFGLNKFAWIY